MLNTAVLNPFPHTTILQQTPLNLFCQNIENLHNWMDNIYDKKWKTLWQKEKLHILCNFFFCHYVFKKPSAAEASESVYMRERVNVIWKFTIFAYLEKSCILITLAHKQQIFSRWLWKCRLKSMEKLYYCRYIYWKNLKT